MEVEILSAESLGTRGMCCLVRTSGRTILIDPGVALGYLRAGLLPHPFQVASGAIIREKIVSSYTDATDIVFSHYHGDHIPLARANPYQLSLQRVQARLRKARLWGLNPENATDSMRSRAEEIALSCGRDIPVADSCSDGEIIFSRAVPHGRSAGNNNKVLMTRVAGDGCVFVHASDIQLLERDTIRQILEWSPDIVFLSGPPLYLQRLSHADRYDAWQNALLLTDNVDTCIIDHHVLRSPEGISWLNKLRRASHNTVVCAADYMKHKRCFLEAFRSDLYRDMPVADGWHDDYARGRADFSGYLLWRGRDISWEIHNLHGMK